MEHNGGRQLDQGYGLGVAKTADSGISVLGTTGINGDDVFDDSSFASFAPVPELVLEPVPDDVFDDSSFASVVPEAVPELVSDFESAYDAGIDLDFGDDDIELLEEAKRRGYVGLDAMPGDVLKALITRVPDNPEQEVEQIRKLLAQEAENFKVLLDDLQASMATNVNSGDRSDLALIYTRMSADTSLSPETSARISDIIYDIVNTSPELIEQMEEPEKELMDHITGMLLEMTEIQQKRDEIRRYIGAILPVMQKQKSIAQEKMRSAYKNRMKVSRTLLTDRYQNVLHALAVAQKAEVENGPSLRYVRNITWDDGHFITTCPHCRKQTIVDSPALQCFAYRDNSGSGIHFFRGYQECKNCKTQLIFTDKEHTALKQWFRAGKIEKLTSLTVEAVAGSPGASVVYVDMPMKHAAAVLPDLIQQAYNGGQRKPDLQKSKATPVMVNGEEISEAAKAFYFKLRGMPSLEEKYCVVSSECIVDWTPHDMAVFIVQTLSNDYYREKARALFSLLSFLSQNPIFKDVLSLDSLWALEQGIGKLDSVLKALHSGKTEKSIRSVIVELNGLLGQFGISISCDAPKEEILLEAKRVLQLELSAKQGYRRYLLKELRKYKKQLSYVKVIHISVVKYMDLLRYCGDAESAKLFDEVADLMLVNHYAADFFDVWTPFVEINTQKLAAIFSENANMGVVKTKLLEIKKDCKLFSDDAFTEMRAIYTDTEDLSRRLHALRRATESLQIYDLSHIITAVDIARCPEMLEVCGVMDTVCQRVVQAAGSNVEYCLLAQGFTRKEIESADVHFIGPQMPARKKDEPLADYLQRLSDGGNEALRLYYGLGWKSREEAITCAVKMCLMSLPYEFDYDNFEKSIFMSAVLRDFCRPVERMSLERMIGISNMHQNVIKRIRNCVADFSSAKALYDLCYASYETTVSQDLEKLFLEMSETDCHVSAGVPNASKLFNMHHLLRDIVMNSDSRIVDGEVISNSAEEVMELAEKLGMTPKELIAYCNEEE